MIALLNTFRIQSSRIVLTKLETIISRWSDTLIESSRIMSVNSRYSSVSNWRYGVILKRILVEVGV